MWIYVVLETWSVFGVEILSGSFCDLSPWTWTFLGVFFLDPEMWTGTAYVPYAGPGFCLPPPLTHLPAPLPSPFSRSSGYSFFGGKTAHLSRARKSQGPE